MSFEGKTLVILVTFHNTCFYLFIISLSERARTSGLSIPNAALYQTELHLVIFGRSLRCRSPYRSKYRPFSRRGCRPLQLDFQNTPIKPCIQVIVGWALFSIFISMLSPLGSNQESSESKSDDLPINLEDIIRPICQRTFSFLRFLSGSN
jgi:hypothetical protein